MMRRFPIMSLLLGAALATSARADGIMFAQIGQTTPLVQTPAQEALLVADRGTVTVVLRTHFQAGPTELAWLVPVPAEPKEVREADEAIFARLADYAAPKFFTVQAHSGLSCGCAKSESDSPLRQPTVTVHSSGNAGIFSFHTLSAKHADDLVKWLTNNGYQVPPQAAPLMSRYIDQNYSWLAMKVRPEKATSATLAPHPITYSYASTKLTFPLVISKMNTSQVNEVLLYVVANGRYSAKNWINATIDRHTIQREPGSPSGTNYETRFKEIAAQDSHTLVTEMAAVLGYDGHNLLPEFITARDDLGICLTRLRGLIPPQAMDRDIEFGLADENRAIGNEFHVSAAQSHLRDIGDTAVMGTLTLGFAMAFLRRR